MKKEIVYALNHIDISAVQWFPEATSDLRVLSLHGWLDNAASFTHLASYLSDFPHTSLDFAGHGLSNHRPEGCFYNIWDHALDVVSILNKSKEPVWLVGHSMGGAVAIIVAAVAPEKVKGLIVLDNVGPSTDSLSDRVPAMQRAITKTINFRRGRYTRYQTENDMVSARMNGFTQLSETASSLLVERGAERRDDGMWVWRHDNRLTFPSPYKMDEGSVSEFFAAISCPTLLLLAKEGIYKNDLFFVEKRIAQFLSAKVKWLDGNHHFHLEDDTASYVGREVQQFVHKYK